MSCQNSLQSLNVLWDIITHYSLLTLSGVRGHSIVCNWRSVFSLVVFLSIRLSWLGLVNKVFSLVLLTICFWHWIIMIFVLAHILFWCGNSYLCIMLSVHIFCLFWPLGPHFPWYRTDYLTSITIGIISIWNIFSCMEKFSN